MSGPGHSRNVRRDSRNGPSPFKHGVVAVTAMTIVILTLYASAQYIKDIASNDNVKKVTITPTAPDDIKNLANDGQTEGIETNLPDLLGGEVPANVNPTEVLAGGTEDTNVTPPQTNDTPQPRLIRINGQPAGRDRATPLIKAPIQGLSRQSPYGPIPAKSETGDTAFLRYAKPFQTPVNAKTVAIIIGGLGLNSEITTRAILDLPEQITLSFAAHSPQLQVWIDQARENGHEVMIEIPMQAIGETPDASNRTLIVTDDIAKNTRNLDWLLSQGSGYFAVTNYNGDAFLSRSDIVAPMMSYLEDTGLGFIFDSSFPSVALPALATSAKLPFIEAEMILDDVNNRDLTRAKLSELTDKARSGHRPIGTGFAYTSTIDAVTAWAATAADEGLVLVPASHLMAP
ncbi:MAG: divergent polysaccharide deacetylase family protein [Maricaulaceae bacterium]